MSNKNIVHVEAIEGLLIQVQEHLGEIVPVYSTLGAALEQAKDEVNDIQTNTVHILRQLCEGETDGEQTDL